MYHIKILDYSNKLTDFGDVLSTVDGSKYHWTIFLFDVVPWEGVDTSYWEIIDCSDMEPFGCSLCWAELLKLLHQTKQWIGGYIVGSIAKIDMSKCKGQIIDKIKDLPQKNVYLFIQIDDGNLISIFSEDVKIIHRFRSCFGNSENVRIIDAQTLDRSPGD